MTLRQVIECLRKSEVDEGADPQNRLVAVIALVASCHRGERVDDTKVALGVEKFKQTYGEVTQQNVDEFCKLPDAMLDINIPDGEVLKIMATDEIALPEDLSKLTDTQLQEWADACDIADHLERMKHDGLEDKAQAALAHDWDSREEFDSKIFDEQERRRDARTKAQVEETLAEPPVSEEIPAPEEPLPQRLRWLKQRAAHLLRMLELEAPESLIQNAIERIRRTPDVYKDPHREVQADDSAKRPDAG